MLVSFCYVVLRRLLQLAALRVRSNDFKELEIVVLRHELAILRRTTQAARINDGRPALPRSHEPVPSAGTLAVVHDHPSDIASMAPALGRETVDLHASGSTTDATRGSGPCGPSRARQSAVGLSTDCWRVEGPGHTGLSDYGADLAEGRRPWTVVHASWDHLA